MITSSELDTNVSITFNKETFGAQQFLIKLLLFTEKMSLITWVSLIKKRFVSRIRAAS